MKTKPDARWSITREFCGHVRPQFIVRFCGKWISSHEKRIGAELAMLEHYQKHKGIK